jgi:1-deoxy-D-xylulose-5-phosphate synthase
MAPADARELEFMIEKAFELGSPVAIKYPRGEAYYPEADTLPIEYGKSVIVENDYKTKDRKENVSKKLDLIDKADAVIFAVGNMVRTALKVKKILEEKGLNLTVVNVRFIKPMDTNFICEASEKYKHIFTLEEGITEGGFGEMVAGCLADKNALVHIMGLPCEFIEHGSVCELREKYGLTPEIIAEKIIKQISVS